jgi:hypothetical protein
MKKEECKVLLLMLFGRQLYKSTAQPNRWQQRGT